MNTFNLSTPFKVSTTRVRTTASICFAACIILCAASATTQPVAAAGKQLFESKCAKCHGANGTLGRWGAKNLQTSKLGNEALHKIISEGKGIMPRWGKKLTAAQIDTVIEYIKTLRN